MALAARAVVIIAIASIVAAQGAGRELVPGQGTSSPSRNSNEQQGSTGPQASLAHTAHSSLSTASTSSPRRELQGAAPTSSAAERHKPLLPVSVQDVFLFILSFLTLALSAAAGIGECRPTLFLSRHARPGDAFARCGLLSRAVRDRALPAVPVGGGVLLVPLLSLVGGFAFLEVRAGPTSQQHASTGTGTGTGSTRRQQTALALARPLVYSKPYVSCV